MSQLKLIVVMDNMELLHQHNGTEMKNVESFDKHYSFITAILFTRTG